MSTFATQAIVLAKRPLWEADRLYVLFSHAFGKIEAQVKSAVLTTSKLAGGLEPVSLVEVMVIKGKSRETIGGVQLLKRYNYSDLGAFGQVSMVRELFIKLIPLGVKEGNLYHDLQRYLELMENTSSGLDQRALTQQFIWNTLAILGYSSDNLREKIFKEFDRVFAADLGSLQNADNLLKRLEQQTYNYLTVLAEKNFFAFRTFGG